MSARPHPSLIILPVVTFCSAMAALALEIAIVRLGAPYVGQALAPWSAAIVSVLLGLALGHMLGGLVGGAQASVHRLRVSLALAWFFAGVAAAAVPLLVAPVTEALSGDQEPARLAVLGLSALVFPSCVAAGLSLPVALRLCVKIADGVRPGRLAVLLAASAIGSVAGSALSGFVLLETVGAVGLARGIAWLWIALGLVILPWHEVRLPLRLLALLPVVIAALLSFRSHVGKACWTETRYTCIQISDKTAQNGDLLRVMALDEGLHSLSDREHPDRLHLAYAALVDKLARLAFVGSATPRALVIGGGGATLPRAWAQMQPPVRSTVAELDRRVAAEAADMMWADSPNIRTIIGDGRAVLRSLKHEPLFDVVLMDAYRSHSVPAHLVSREFNAEVERHLTKPGVFLSNVIDRYASLHLAASVAATLRQTFPVVDVWITDADGAGMTNAVIAAWSDVAQALRPQQMTVDVTRWNAGETTHTEQVIWRRFSVDELVQTRGLCTVVLTDDWAPVDRLLAGRSVCAVPAKKPVAP
ncbi:fused MFS/spermidine synthase [Methylocella sp. CPCC 101449]|uniref:fused MFS/spermidine synthase n=1 Tax=Methylocella sp. CPCC 101449 TaxID=2987531 RepID=UPI00288DB82C|nr:fused MFS/spermidine synthase [Methylocella sp. CPCC 101449]MDT2020867.1 fused MFS/spermidine synthase [Methylocella sp. CPCC 101449]